MLKRIVNTNFWTDMQVIEQYSIEDKYFYLYLMTNGKTTQVGIYPLPIKVISFETGFTTEVVKVLLDRFENDYKQIQYSEKTQEVTVLHSLKHTIIKGGKPVTDLLEKELSRVNDVSLILETYEVMEEFWTMSKRKYDQTVKDCFLNELANRGYYDNEKEKDKEIDDENQNVNQNVNDNEESWDTNRSTVDNSQKMDVFINHIKAMKPDLQTEINLGNILNLYYECLFGQIDPSVVSRLNSWERKMPKLLILEALTRSVNANNPLYYANSIIENWFINGVDNFERLNKYDQHHNKDRLFK